MLCSSALAPSLGQRTSAYDAAWWEYNQHLKHIPNVTAERVYGRSCFFDFTIPGKHNRKKPIHLNKEKL